MKDMRRHGVGKGCCRGGTVRKACAVAAADDSIAKDIM